MELLAILLFIVLLVIILLPVDIKQVNQCEGRHTWVIRPEGLKCAVCGKYLGIEEDED